MSILNQIDFDVPSSRNTSEFLDDDESESLKDDVKTLHVQAKKCDDFERLIVGVYGCGSIFLESLIGMEGMDDVGTVTYGKKVVAKLSRFGEALFVTFCEHLNESDVMGVVTDLFDEFKIASKGKVMILSGLTQTNVFEEEEDLPQMRRLCNSFWKGSSSTKKLEPPSFVSGISAAFLSLCEMYKVPCAAFVVPQTTHIRVDIESVAAFEPALSLALNDEKTTSAILKQFKSMKIYRKTIRSSKLDTERRSTAHLYI